MTARDPIPWRPYPASSRGCGRKDTDSANSSVLPSPGNCRRKQSGTFHFESSPNFERGGGWVFPTRGQLARLSHIPCGYGLEVRNNLLWLHLEPRLASPKPPSWPPWHQRQECALHETH